MAKPDFRSFGVSVEWQMIVQQLINTKNDYIKEMVEQMSKGAWPAAAVLAGKIQMIDELFDVPNYLNSISRGKEEVYDAPN